MNGTPLWYFQKDQPSRTSSEGVVIEPAIGVGGAEVTSMWRGLRDSKTAAALHVR